MKTITLIISIVVAGCFQSITAQKQVVKDSLSISKTISLNETIRFDGYEIRFKKVLSDSRCPKNVTCVRAGEAKVLISITKDGKLIEESKIIIDASGYVMESNNLTFNTPDFKIYGYSLTPYPKGIDDIKNKDYRLEILFQPKTLE